MVCSPLNGLGYYRRLSDGLTIENTDTTSAVIPSSNAADTYPVVVDCSNDACDMCAVIVDCRV